MRVGSFDTGAAIIDIRKAGRGRVELLLDCHSGSKFGDGTSVAAGTLTQRQAHELVTRLVDETPWLQRALAMHLMEQLLEHGTKDVEAK
ncbi:hypothetical protein ACFYYY_21405 [Streptomyces sp. NPDC001834]|uniref:hypothetical protein n=1 Tax=Streptomyces sp. NPDC001834 TaxID=3364616 RepID=UPI0036826059